MLSGTGTDGASGIKRIKENGGLALVQEPTEAEYEDMPRNSLATGLIDYITSVKVTNAGADSRLSGPFSDEAKEEDTGPQAPDVGDAARSARRCCAFAPATIFRTTNRQLSSGASSGGFLVHGLPDARQYFQILRERPEEVGLLLNELLISVTNFFRDPGGLLHPRAARDSKTIREQECNGSRSCMGRGLCNR